MIQPVRLPAEEWQTWGETLCSSISFPPPEPWGSSEAANASWVACRLPGGMYDSAGCGRRHGILQEWVAETLLALLTSQPSGSALARWVRSRVQCLRLLLPPPCAAPGLIWHLPEEQLEALSLLPGLTSRTGVLHPCSRHSHWEPAVGIHWSPLLGSPAGHQVCCKARVRGGCTAWPSPVPWQRELCHPCCDWAGVAVPGGSPAPGGW